MIPMKMYCKNLDGNNDVHNSYLVRNYITRKSSTIPCKLLLKIENSEYFKGRASIFLSDCNQNDQTFVIRLQVQVDTLCVFANILFRPTHIVR